MHELSLTIIIILVFAGMFAGMIDTLGGGGGLVSLPTLLAIGVPPASALGTNKLQSIIGELIALSHSRVFDVMGDCGLAICSKVCCILQ